MALALTWLTSELAAQGMVALLALGVVWLLAKHQSPVLLARGMSEADVEAAMGRPGVRSTSARYAKWIYADVHDQRAVVTFRSGRLERVRYE